MPHDSHLSLIELHSNVHACMTLVDKTLDLHTIEEQVISPLLLACTESICP